MLGFATSWDPVKGLPDLTGKVALITGGNAGIGAAIVEQLALHGAKVYLGARSEERAKTAIKNIENAHPSIKDKGLISWHPLDLTEPADVVKSAKDFMEKEKRLDILINNAARLAIAYELSKHNIELSTAINHIGHFVLVQTLLPLLKETAAAPNSDVRIIIMSSEAIRIAPTIKSLATLEDINAPYLSFTTARGFLADMMRYSYTKTLNELFKIELMRRLITEAPKILVISTHPGLVNTETAVDTYPFLIKSVARFFGTTPAEGAHSGLFAGGAVEPRAQFDKYNGAYLNSNTAILDAPAQAKDPRLASELWTLTQDIVDKILAGEM